MIFLMLLTACVTPSSHDPGTGARLFATYCTSCHGANARGDGIANPSSVDFYDHRHMPIWGYDFYGNGADDERAHREAGDRVSSLVAYLETIQRQK